MRRYSFGRIRRYLFLQMAKLPIPGHKRHFVLRMAGIKFPPPSECDAFIGAGVRFDTLCPENITIGNHTLITAGTTVLTHYYDPFTRDFRTGRVVVGEGVFIGVNTIVCKSVAIGDGAVVGAGSVVTKDIPAGEVWAGNPARFVRKL